MSKLNEWGCLAALSALTAVFSPAAVCAGEAFPVYTRQRVAAAIELKVPGNPATVHPLRLDSLADDYYDYALRADGAIPVRVSQRVRRQGNVERVVTDVTAAEDVWFRFELQLATGSRYEDCQFYLPGFWYHRNERSPLKAPSVRVSENWTVREDRLSTPLCGIYDERTHEGIRVVRISDFGTDALWTHREGEVLLGGSTSIGYTGFGNRDGRAVLEFGYPYRETPYSYIRKLTLAPAVASFVHLPKGRTVSLVWEVSATAAADYSDFIVDAWRYSYDTYAPAPVDTLYSIARMKEVMSNYFIGSYVDDYPVKFMSSARMRVADCANHPYAEVGFVGRVLLNAFNALEYGEQTARPELTELAQSIFDSYLEHGITRRGLFREVMVFDARGKREPRDLSSIRRQSEGAYAVLHYLQYEKLRNRSHPGWEQVVRRMLDRFVAMQNPDGSFPRKFRDDGSVVDPSGGSTPSATLPLVMGACYFGEPVYLECALRTGDYLEKELISRGDYFSSTLDADCEDKEASLYAATAMWYLAQVSEGTERERFTRLCRKAAYFAVSWYYTWDVPFARGQMLGDIGLKTRGWGNVSVENNHIDVFVFEFADVLRWLSQHTDEPRFGQFARVIETSMRQLLPVPGRLCGVARAGYYPEVVQHTNWDYGRNGKGYYNDIFAPGWTVASLWELFSAGRTERFLEACADDSDPSATISVAR